jgi:hypothetical protein
MSAQVENESCFHIYREANPIFIDDQDFQVFRSFLNDYLTGATNHQDSKTTFQIRGRTFRGIPRRPKNFSQQIVLIDSKLQPSRFDLVVKEITPGAVEKFIRALSTRYAIYFNKRHKRTGPLFKDPFVSQQVKEPIKNSEPQPATPLNPRIPEMIFAAVILVFFTSFGALNIKASKPPISQTQKPQPPITISSSSIGVLGSDIGKPTPKPIEKVIINAPVNIHESPGTSSPVITRASQGDTYELMSTTDNWHQIKLLDGTNGYVSSAFSQIQKEDGEL